MAANKLKVQGFRANDLSPDTGKQFELGRTWCDFFGIDNSVDDVSFKLIFKPLSKTHEHLKDHQVELQLSGLTSRNDRKAYANGARSGHSAIKEFFLEDLHLTSQNNSGDYFAIYKATEFDYYLYYIPKLLHDNFIRFFESISPKVTINRAIDTDNSKVQSLQQIYYGAPGTGKSHEIKKKTKGEAVVRTTFHPDSDYSTFVGAYKPIMDNIDSKVVPVVLGETGTVFNKNEGTYKEPRIVYRFVMQAFLKAYLGAWKKYADATNDEVEPQFLVIEEINRGNCAQIFGDLFQLLDRNENRFSEYPIEADTDLQQEIERAFKEHKDYKLEEGVKINAEGAVKDYKSNYDATLSEDIQAGRILLLPPNLYIWATMNTSDQSLFPIDSAFKRRWDWKYMKIKDEGKDWKIDVELNVKDADGNPTTKKLGWWPFIEKINDIIASMTSSADKQLGYFFCKATENEEGESEPTIITKDTFVSKVIFYLWNDVFKDYGFEDASLFQYKETIGGNEVTRDLTFPDFYDKDGEHVNTERLKGFLESVMNWQKNKKEQR